MRAIAERGHEVGLHTHPSPALDFYQRPLFRLEPKQQADVIRWGVDLIEGWLGAPPTSFRAGGYALDDRTFKALEGAGIAIDSSCFFPSPNNRLEPRFTVESGHGPRGAGRGAGHRPCYASPPEARSSTASSTSTGSPPIR